MIGAFLRALATVLGAVLGLALAWWVLMVFVAIHYAPTAVPY